MIHIEEIWKDIPGYEGLYQASTRGQIRSLPRTVTYVKHYADFDVTATHHFEGKVLNQSYTSGYLGVLLSVEGHVKDALVHRLVALTFLPNPENKPQVDHIDGNRANNSVENLRWVTSRENHASTMDKGQHTSQQLYKKQSIRDVDTGEIFESMLAAEKKYNIPRGRISAAIKSGQRVYGHRFELYSRAPKKMFNL